MHYQLDFFFQLREKVLLLASLNGKSSGRGHDWPLRTGLYRITPPEAIRSAQAVHYLCKIQVLYKNGQELSILLLQSSSITI